MHLGQDASAMEEDVVLILDLSHGLRALLSPVSSATLRRRQGAAGGADQLARAWDAARAD